jgi:hypothetical protein
LPQNALTALRAHFVKTAWTVLDTYEKRIKGRYDRSVDIRGDFMDSQGARQHQNTGCIPDRSAVFIDSLLGHLITRRGDDRPTSHQFSQFLQAFLHFQNLISPSGSGHGGASPAANNIYPVKLIQLFGDCFKRLLSSNGFHDKPP